MRRMLWLLAVLVLLLAGCAEEDTPVQTTTAPPTTETTQATEPTDPGLYDPDSDVEAASGGALRSYPLGTDYGVGIAAMGENLLLMTTDEIGTKLTLLKGENCTEAAFITVTSPVYPDSGSFHCNENGIVYYDSYSRCVVQLDAGLKETGRVAVPEDMQGEPVIAPDGSEIFYCTENSVRALSLDTGVSRLVRQHECQWQAVQQVIFGGSIVECFVFENDGSSFVCYLSAETGELLGKDEFIWNLETWEQRYILQRTNGYLDEVLFDMGSGVQSLMPLAQETLYGLPQVQSVLGVREHQLGWYDLTSGLRIASTQLGEDSSVYSVAPGNGFVWVLAYHAQSDQDILYRWEPEKSPTGDETVYTSTRYTAENPDTAGLAALQAQADDLGARYGVKIALSETVEQPWDYTLTYEFRTDALRYALTELEKGLLSYPEGFLQTMVEQTGSKTLCISLVRDISDDVRGVQYWVESNACIAIEIGGTVEQTLYHEVSHVLDNYIIAGSYAYDDWEDLNPDGVQYDYNYEDYLVREDLSWTQGENRAFIDSYSMSYPKEDRARILEYAMTSGNEGLFTSETMQRKLLQICKGIRECFGYERCEETFLWEQYLNESLAYSK